MKNLTIDTFVKQLATTQPIPGGGGASALLGATGAALGAMATNLTAHNKRFLNLQPQMQKDTDSLKNISINMLDLIQADADAFEPLSKAYSLPRETEEESAEKDRVLQAALIEAAQPPIQTMRKCIQALGILKNLVNTVNPLVVSDIGCGASSCRACIECAALNVRINANMITDKKISTALLEESNRILINARELAESIYSAVEDKI